MDGKKLKALAAELDKNLKTEVDLNCSGSRLICL